MFFAIIMLLVTVVVLSVVLWQFHKTIQRLQTVTQPRLVTPDHNRHEAVVTIPILEQLQRALPGTLWVISVSHAHHGHLVYTALMKEPTTTDRQMQDWAEKNAESLNPLDPNHHKAWRRLINTVFQKVKDGIPLAWADLLLIKIGYDLCMPYPNIELGYRDFIAGTIRDPKSGGGTMDGLKALRDSATKATLKQTHYDLPSFKGIATD